MGTEDISEEGRDGRKRLIDGTEEDKEEEEEDKGRRRGGKKKSCTLEKEVG